MAPLANTVSAHAVAEVELLATLSWSDCTRLLDHTLCSNTAMTNEAARRSTLLTAFVLILIPLILLSLLTYLFWSLYPWDIFNMDIDMDEDMPLPLPLPRPHLLAPHPLTPFPPRPPLPSPAFPPGPNLDSSADKTAVPGDFAEPNPENPADRVPAYSNEQDGNTND